MNESLFAMDNKQYSERIRSLHVPQIALCVCTNSRKMTEILRETVQKFVRTTSPI